MTKTINEIIRQLSDEDLHLIDFDEVKKYLLSLKSSLSQYEHCQNELGVLREDYQNRIAGMVKAIATVERQSDSSNEALVYLDKLVELSAAELIAEYRKTSARFRSAFPTTFGLLPARSKGHSRLKNPEVYK